MSSQQQLTGGRATRRRGYGLDDPTNSPFGKYLLDEKPDTDPADFPERFAYWKRGEERLTEGRK